MWITVSGKIQVWNGVRIIASRDLCRYYQWLIRSEKPWIKTQLPTHGAHVTLCNPKIHKVNNFSIAKYLNGKKVEFQINPEDVFQSRVNFWLPAQAAIYQEVKSLLGFKEIPNWYGLHLTVANQKFNG